MNLRDLFPELQDGRSFEGSFGQWQPPTPHVITGYTEPQFHQTPKFSTAQQQYTPTVHHAAPISDTGLHNAPYLFPNDLDFLLTNDDTAILGGNPA